MPDPCMACGAEVTRALFSDYFKCANGHTIWRGPQSKPPRYELRATTSNKWNAEEEGGTHDVWDLLEQEPYYNSAGDWYAYGLSEGRARSLLRRLNTDT